MNLLDKFEKSTVFVCNIVLASIFFCVVLMRYVFETDLFAYEEWVLLLAFLLYFAGGAIASRHDHHIKADIIVELIKNPRHKQIYSIIIQMIEGLILLGITFFAIRMFLNEFQRWPNIPTTTVYKIPLAVPRFFITMGFILMTFHAFRNSYRGYLNLKHEDNNKTRESEIS